MLNNITLHPGGLVHVCVLYSNNGYAAERSIIVDQLVPLITSDIKDKIQVTYVAYTNIEEIISLYIFGVRIYISALNSNQCLALKNTFFDEYSDAIHLNSFSTSTEFITTYNLLRNLTPDSYSARLYTKIMDSTLPIILYDSTSSWSIGLKNDIIDSWSSAPIVTIEINLEPYVTILESLIPSMDTTIVLLEDTNSGTILQNIFNATITYTYDLILGDALAQYEFPSLVSELQLHNALLIQSYVTQQQIQYTNDINILLNQPQHPASDLVIYFKQLFDIAILHSKTKRDYVDLHLSTSFDSTNGQYSIMIYDNSGKPVEHGYGLVDDTNVIIGTIV